MSFSQDVKQEIAGHIPQSRTGALACLSAMYIQCGHRNALYEGRPALVFQTENVNAATMCFTLLKKTFNIYIDVCVRKAHTVLYMLKVRGNDALQVSESVAVGNDADVLKSVILDDADEKRAFITGAFMCSGSMSDPSHSYHFEIVCSNEAQAGFLRDVIDSFDIDGKIVIRKKYHVVYVKEGEQIVDMLNIMEAHVSLMNMENLRIVKDMRNSVNRRVNCETANITKTVSAAVRQIEDIEYIISVGKIKSLDRNLQQMAQIRLENPELPLKELGGLLNPPVGKSGVNHRLRKLSEFADSLRSTDQKDGGML